MSARYDDDPNRPSAEDDWFAEPPAAPWDPPAPAEPAWPEYDEVAPQPPRRPPDSRRIGLVVAAVTLAVAIIALGVLVVRAVSGSDEAGTPIVTTTPTVPDTTLPDATTPDTTTPDTTTPDTTPPTGGTTLPEGVVLRPGDSGDNVIALQTALQQAGYDTGEIDGDYGTLTSQAVAAFQTAEGLSVDGIAGPETLTALAGAVAAG